MKRILLFFIYLSFSFYFVQVAESQNKKALLIGIDNYNATNPDNNYNGSGRPIPNLFGCVNDVKLFKELLKARYDFKESECKVLLDEKATKENILNTIVEYLIDDTKKGDIIIFYYAGHGSQVKNSLSNERDKMDESIVPYGSSEDILDVELKLLFNIIIDKGAILTTVFDCCHSGSIQKGITTTGITRGAEPSKKDYKLLRIKINNYEDSYINIKNDENPEQRGALIISACQDFQKAYEIKENGVNHGSLSYALSKSLYELPKNASLDELFLSIKSKMESFNIPQEPVFAINSFRKKKNFLGTSLSEEREEILLSISKIIDNNSCEIIGGIINGVYPGTVLKSRNSSSNIKLIVEKSIGLNKSLCKIESKYVKLIKPGEILIVENWAPVISDLKVWIPGKMKYSEIVYSIETLKKIFENLGFNVVSNPFKDSISIVFYDSKGWFLKQGTNQPILLGKNISSNVLYKIINENKVLKTNIFISLPLIDEAYEEILSNIKSIKSLNFMDANYLLLGKSEDEVFSYSWIMPNINPDDSLEINLPVRTDWIEYKQEKKDFFTKKIKELIKSIARIRMWQVISSPYDNFPYRLLLKNDSGLYKRSGTLINGERYKLVLSLKNKNKREYPFPSRYIYVFCIDSYGKTTLIYPSISSGNNENRFPLEKEKMALREEIELSEKCNLKISPPFGIDTYIMVATEEAIVNYHLLGSDGVITKGETTNELENFLLNLTDAKSSSGFKSKLGIDRIIFKTKNK